MDQVFREAVRSGRPLAGTFIKTGAPEITEVIGHAGMDFALIDAEHAPLGMEAIDRLVLGGRAASLPCLVRLPTLAPGLTGRMLDLGAAGVAVPHVTDADVARTAVAEARYRGGRRGFSPSTRAGGYGLGDTAGYAARADAGCSLWCQIEDAVALDRLDAIATVEGVDLLFIGRADLAMSLGVGSPRHERVAEAVATIAAAGVRHGMPVGIFLPDMAEAPALLAQGITLFTCGSDQSHLAAAAAGIMRAKEALRP